MEEFDTWISKNSRRYETCVDSQVTLSACQLVVASNMNLYKPMREPFRLRGKPATVVFCNTVRDFVSKKNFNEAAQCVLTLDLQKHFNIKDIVLPLILQDNINLVKNYVQKSQAEQMKLVTLLDMLIDENIDMDEVKRESGVPEIKHDRVKRKNLRKLANRLMKEYNVPEESCPNIKNCNLRGALLYLLNRKYLEKSIEAVPFEEIVLYSIADNTCLQKQFVDDLLSYQDVHESARWAHHFQLAEEHLPQQVVELLNEHNTFVPIGEAEDLDSDCGDNLYYTLPIPFEAIQWVDNADDFNACMRYLTKPYTTIAIDGEWRPQIVSTTTGSSKLALIQMATVDRIYLVDVIALKTVLTKKDWRKFAEDIFANDTIIKLGYGISGDMDMLKAAFPNMTQSLQDAKCMIDILHLQNQINTACPDVFKKPDASSVHHGGSSVQEKGLSELVRVCLGRSLDKREQMSDWERRPLRRHQLIYAALDAYCLLGVHAKLTDIIQTRHLRVLLDAKPQRTAAANSKKAQKKKAQEN